MGYEEGKLFTIAVYDKQGEKVEEKSEFIFIDKKGIFAQDSSSIPDLVFNFMANGKLSDMERWLAEHGFASFCLRDPMPEVLREAIREWNRPIILSRYSIESGYDSSVVIDHVNNVLGLKSNQRQ